MTPAYVLTILVTSGDPDGVRVVEKSNWSGVGVVFARADFAEARKCEINSPGVYVLFGEDENAHDCMYVGEADDVGTRLVQHLRNQDKDFWTSTVVFTSRGMGLNKAHIRYLESRLIDLASKNRRVRLANTKQPPLPPMSATDVAQAEGFLTEMLAIFPILGVHAFDRAEGRQSTGTRYFLKGPDARGEGVDRNDGFIVFKGATARVGEVASIGSTFHNLRTRLVANGLFLERDGRYDLIDDYVFSSPTSAAAALLGRTANGRVEWKDAAGVTLKEHQARAAEASS